MPTASAAAGERPELRFSRKTDLPGIGLQVLLMPDASPCPLPPPTAHSYRATLGEKSWNQDLFSPLELWRLAQHAGLWKDKYGNTLTLAAIAMAPPLSFGRQHVSREEFEEGTRLLLRRPDEWSPDSIREWATYFTGAAIPSALPVPRRPARLAELLTLTAPGAPANVTFYAFRLRRPTVGSTRMPLQWFFAGLQTHPGIPAAAARQAAVDTFFASPAVIPQSPQRDTPSAVFQNPDEKKRVPETEEMRAGRRQIADSIRNLKGWWYVETPHYIILSNLASSHRALVLQLQTEIEILREAYIRVAPPLARMEQVGVVRVFGSEREYLEYVGADLAWTGGIWVPAKRELVIRPASDWEKNRDERERILRSIRHEAFHQHVFHAMDRVVPPPWYNEGHAALFETSDLRNDAVRILEDDRKVALLKPAFARDPKWLESLLRMDYPAFYAGTDADRETHYALAWGLAYYLRKGVAAEDRSPYRGLLDRYAEALVRTRDPGAAEREAFGSLNLLRLSDDIAAFWGSRSRRSAARKEDIAAAPLRRSR